MFSRWYSWEGTWNGVNLLHFVCFAVNWCVNYADASPLVVVIIKYHFWQEIFYLTSAEKSVPFNSTTHFCCKIRLYSSTICLCADTYIYDFYGVQHLHISIGTSADIISTQYFVAVQLMSMIFIDNLNDSVLKNVSCQLLQLTIEYFYSHLVASHPNTYNSFFILF